MSLPGEIKRRKVVRVAAVYAVVAWLIMQGVDVVNEPLSLPAWFDTVVILLLAIGFPVARVSSRAGDRAIALEQLRKTETLLVRAASPASSTCRENR